MVHLDGVRYATTDSSMFCAGKYLLQSLFFLVQKKKKLDYLTNVLGLEQYVAMLHRECNETECTCARVEAPLSRCSVFTLHYF